MKIYINLKTKDGAWGGGNQFLKALHGEFTEAGFLSNSKDEADVILFNGYQDLLDMLKSFIFNNQKKRVYRLGPIMALHRSGIKWKLIDRIIILFANFFADLVIFQSKWSHDMSCELGFRNKKYAIILNAVDGKIFYKKELGTRKVTDPIKLIYTSWSKNKNKGFLFLSFLDENLDFDKYDFKFIGNSPVTFKNIKTLYPLNSIRIAEELRGADIFVSPAKDDACSNAIIEALSCGLPVIALNSGANEEIIKDGGASFRNAEEMLRAIEMVSSNLEKYQNQIQIKNIEDISREYALVIKNILK